MARTSPNVVAGLLICAASLIAVPSGFASDPENCLMCHRYSGLARVSDDGTRVESYQVDASYYDHLLGPHSRLQCTACHRRSEVEVIPHHPVSPVDCSRACHIVLPGRPEIEFSHASVAELLVQSVHPPQVLDECNRLLGQPLQDGQSRCLLCHAEPHFRRSDETWLDEQESLARCSSCHTEELWVDTTFSFWHVHARSRPSKKPLQLARQCAICHSDPAMREAFGLPDTIASYLVSFHGKAMLLGSEQTADCLDCHAAPPYNVHHILAAAQPDSPTNAGHLPDTCRSAACHPAAGQQISSAAIHLELTPSRAVPDEPRDPSIPDRVRPAPARTVEYFIAVFFVLLILATFGPSLALQVLELLQIVFDRRDPAHHQRLALANSLLAHPIRKKALTRFSVYRRIEHWVLFICFTVLVATGFPIKFAWQPWARWTVDAMGGLGTVRQVHRWAGLVLIGGAICHLGYIVVIILRSKKQTGKGLLHAFFDLPMVMRPSEIRKLFQLLGFLLFLRPTRPQFGRFALREKFEYFGVFWGCAILGVTGLMMWEHALTTRYLSGRVLTISSLIHTFEALLALLHVGVIHLVGVILSPQVFPMSPAMFTGYTPVEELVEAHSEMLLEAGGKEVPTD